MPAPFIPQPVTLRGLFECFGVRHGAFWASHVAVREQQAEPRTLAPLLFLGVPRRENPPPPPPPQRGRRRGGSSPLRPKLPGDDELVDHGLCRALCSKAPQASLLGILLRNSVAGIMQEPTPPPHPHDLDPRQNKRRLRGLGARTWAA